MNGFNTRAVHVGSEPDAATGAVNPAVYLTSTYAQDAVGVVRFSDYARGDNPTRSALETCLANLEEASHGIAFASGLAGEDALLRTLAPGDHVILGDDAYGGTYRLITRIFGAWGVTVTSVDLSDRRPHRSLYRLDEDALGRDPEQPDVERCLDPRTRGRRPRTLGTAGRRQHLRDAVPAASAHPWGRRGGALDDEYVGGHSDVIGGFVATNNDELAAQSFHQYAIGAVPGPLDCYPAAAGSQDPRDSHGSSLRERARHCRVSRESRRRRDVYYRVSSDTPGHEVARSQMSDFGGMVSFTVNGGVDVARKVCESTSVFILAESLGGVESLIELPSAMTHLSTSGSTLEPPDDLIRLSVGIEDIDDLLADLDRALSI